MGSVEKKFLLEKEQSMKEHNVVILLEKDYKKYEEWFITTYGETFKQECKIQKTIDN